MAEYDPPFYLCTVDRLYEMWMSRTYANVVEKMEAEISFWSLIAELTTKEANR